MKNGVLAVVMLISLLITQSCLAGERENAMNNDTFQKLLKVNDRFYPVLNVTGTHNGRTIELIRYERKGSDKVNYHDSNVSLLINEDGGLQGLSRLLPDIVSGENQVTKKQAEEVAVKFLSEYAPDLLNNYKVQWVDKHIETISGQNGDITLEGMKVKCRNLNDGLYFWVVIAPDNTVMIFERDIEWDFIKSGRQTERWLHDDWLKVRMAGR
jgi:hypothetical protein